MNPAPGTQLSLINEPSATRGTAVNARLALNVLSRLLAGAPGVSEQSALYFKAVFSPVCQAAELGSGLPVTKTSLRPLLLNPAPCITQSPPKRPDEFAQMETLLEFIQRRLSSALERSRLEQDLELLLGPGNPELLVTQEGIASALFSADRAEAAKLFGGVPDINAPEAAEALIEAFVLMRANHADVHTGIAKLFWSENISAAEVRSFIEGCADGQARGYFHTLLSLPEERHRAVFGKISLESFYAAFGERNEGAN